MSRRKVKPTRTKPTLRRCAVCLQRQPSAKETREDATVFWRMMPHVVRLKDGRVETCPGSGHPCAQEVASTKNKKIPMYRDTPATQKGKRRE